MARSSFFDDVLATENAALFDSAFQALGAREVVFETNGPDLIDTTILDSVVADALAQYAFDQEAFASSQANFVAPPPGVPEHILLVDNGPSENRIDIWYVGDGYTEAQRQDLLDDVMTQFNSMTSASTLNDPFGRYASFFNVHVLFQASVEEGADKPEDGIFVDTAFNASYSWNGGVERLLYFSTGLADAAINAVIPAGVDVDMRFGTVNSSQYGGGGGSYAVYAANNSSTFELALHEQGHSYAGLADEYYTTGATYSGGEPSGVNVTTDSNGNKWSHWLGYDDGALGVIGAFEGARYNEFGVYRPTDNSKMRNLNQPFDAIAKEKFILDFYAQVDPLDDWSDQVVTGVIINPLSLSVVSIDATVFTKAWAVDGAVIAGEAGESLDVTAQGLAVGSYNISAIVTDETDKVRISLDQLTQTVSWGIRIATDDFIATGFDDLANGLASDDVIDGLAGQDTINGGGGLDTLAGGAGDDLINGGDGNDVIFGDALDMAQLSALLDALGIA